MLIVKELIGHKKDGTPKYNLRFNKEYWSDVINNHGQINVVIDEAHQFFNPRRSMSKINVIMSDFLSMLRRILGNKDGTGQLVLITQLERRLDIIAKEMSTNVSYSICHFMKVCKCGFHRHYTNEDPEIPDCCPVCDKILKKRDHIIETWKFSNIELFHNWYVFGARTYYKRYMINDIEQYFRNYNTLQWDDMFSEFV